MFRLLRQRDFGLLWLAGLISFAGDAALVIALPLHIFVLTDSTLATAGVLAATALPRVLLGSVAGVFVDRWNRKWTMVIADTARAALLLPILVAPDHLPTLYFIATIQGTIGLVFRPAEGALLPKLVGEKHLVEANAANSLNNSFGFLIGPAAGALLYAETGVRGIVIADIGTFILSAALIAAIRTDARPEDDPSPSKSDAIWSRLVRDWQAGIAVVADRQTLRVLFGASALSSIADGVFVTLGLSPLVLEVLKGTAAQVGWLATAQAIGGLIAGVIVMRFGRRLSRRWLVGGGMIGVGLADLGAANTRLIAPAGTPAVGVAMGYMVAAGPPAVAIGAGRQTIIQQEAADAYRGRVFGAFDSLQGVAQMVGFATGGILGDAVGIVPVLSAAAFIRIAGGVGLLRLMPRSAPISDSRDL